MDELFSVLDELGGAAGDIPLTIDEEEEEEAPQVLWDEKAAQRDAVEAEARGDLWDPSIPPPASLVRRPEVASSSATPALEVKRAAAVASL